MAELSLGLVVQIGLRLIQNRQKIATTWERVDKLVAEAMRLMPEVQDLMVQIAPELLPQTATVITQQRGRVVASTQPVPAYDTRWVQQALNHLLQGTQHVPLQLDGKMGPRTEAAIEHYQKSRGLQVDGLVGPVTMASLDAEVRRAWR